MRGECALVSYMKIQTQLITDNKDKTRRVEREYRQVMNDWTAASRALAEESKSMSDSAAKAAA